jgi:hypothetical protein
MGIFKKAEDKQYASFSADPIKAPESKEKTVEEEWVWIEGYKATDKDMKCKGYQFELGKTFTHEGELIGCKSGFHFCPRLNDCFGYYKIGNGNRYFKVRALVNLHQKYGYTMPGYPSLCGTGFMRDTDKRVAKKIEFLEEISPEEIIKILYPASHTEMSEKLKSDIIQFGAAQAFTFKAIDELKETNIYSAEMIDIIVASDKIKLAYALAKENISQDTRLTILFR